MKYLFLACVALLLAGCSDAQKEENYLKSVHVCDVGSGAEASGWTFAGVVEENDNISLGFKTAGQIHRIFVKEGDRVRRGQLLAELDGSDYQLGVDALQIQYDQLKEEVERAKRLYEMRSMSANDYEKAVAGLRQLGVQLQVNKNKLAYTKLYALTSGIIESVNFAPAEMVDAGTAVFTLLDVGRMQIVCDIPAGVYLRRDEFRNITCRSAHGGEEIPVSLISIVPKADGNQLYRMQLALGAAAAKEITSGMNVEVRIEGECAKGEIRLPASSLFRKGNDSYVWVLRQDSTVTARKVQLTGEMKGAEVAILDGVGPTDKVVRAGVSMLHEGEKVKVIKKESATNAGGLL